MTEPSKQEILFELHRNTCDDCLTVMQAKQADYAHGEDPFVNFRMSEALGIHPALGIMLRITDKLQRVRSFLAKGYCAVDNESVEDALDDMVNYVILIKGLLRDEQKGVDSAPEEGYNNPHGHQSPINGPPFVD